MIDSFDLYMKEISQIPVLTQEQEIVLVKQVQSGNQTIHDQAYIKLTQANLRLVAKIAYGFKGYGLPINDLISVGNIALMHSVEKFDPSKGTRFATYASCWIKQFMQRAIAYQVNIIRTPDFLSAKNKRRKRTVERMTREMGHAPTNAELSITLGALEKEVTIHSHYSYKTVSIHSPSFQIENENVCFGDFLSDASIRPPDQIIGEDELSKELIETLNQLDERERLIINLRFGLNGNRPMTLDEVSIRLRRTRERVRQIQNEALQKMRAYLTEETCCI